MKRTRSDENGPQMPDDSIAVILSDGANLPVRKSAGACGYDIFSYQTITLLPGKTSSVSTGIRLEIPEGYYGRIESRSGLACKSIHVIGGIIDSDYRGEIKIILHNSSSSEFLVTEGDRIAQLIIQKYETFHLEVTESLSKTDRGEEGFGSTGIK